MTFPAHDAFDADARTKKRHVQVYVWCRRFFDFTQIRDKKLDTIASGSGVNVTVVSRVLDDLVTWGYLLEHPRGKFRERRFTLLWSCPPGDVAPFATTGATE